MRRHANRFAVRMIALLGIMVLLLFAGCSRELNTRYGANKGIFAGSSVNGFTTLRDAFGTAGYTTRDLGRLTDRVRGVSVVVWTPSHPTGIDVATTRWFESWLRMGGKTLIYVIPDSGSETTFYRDARPLADPKQRLEYRRRYAEGLIREHRWQINRSTIASNGWFAAIPKTVSATSVTKADSDSGSESDSIEDDLLTSRRFEWVLEAYDPEVPGHKGSQVWEPVGPGSVTWGGNSSSIAPTSVPVEFDSLLTADTGESVVAKVTSENWNQSQILVVAGGSVLTNYGLTRPANQRLAAELIDRTLSTNNIADLGEPSSQIETEPEAVGERIAAFATANGSFPISKKAGEIPRATGAELLTVFPISFVTIHIAILGLVICLVLLPVFGRPAHIDRGVLTHFGDHLDAVATLMRRRGGEHYARQRISEYMKRIHGETINQSVTDSLSQAPRFLDPSSQRNPQPVASDDPSTTRTQADL